MSIPEQTPTSSAGSIDAGASSDEETGANTATDADCAQWVDAGTDGPAEEDRPPPEVRVGSSKFRSVSLGLHHACGMRDNDTIACWGNDLYGQATPPEGEFRQRSGWRDNPAVSRGSHSQRKTSTRAFSTKLLFERLAESGALVAHVIAPGPAECHDH